MSKIVENKLAIATVAGLSIGMLLYQWRKGKSAVEINSSYPSTQHLDQASAEARKSQIIDNVNYNLFLNLNKGDTFSGKVKIYFQSCKGKRTRLRMAVASEKLPDQ